MTKDKREELAKIAHESWAGWTAYLLSKCIAETEKTSPSGNVYKTTHTGAYIIPTHYVERWKRQILTPYDELSEEEKDSDRIEADKYIKAMGVEYHNLNDFYQIEDRSDQIKFDDGWDDYDDISTKATKKVWPKEEKVPRCKWLLGIGRCGNDKVTGGPSTGDPRTMKLGSSRFLCNFINHQDVCKGYESE